MHREQLQTHNYYCYHSDYQNLQYYFRLLACKVLPASAYLNSGSITTGREFALLLENRKSIFIYKQFLLRKSYKRSFRPPSSSGQDWLHLYYSSYLYLPFLKISSNRSLKSRDSCFILTIRKQLTVRIERTRCQRKALPSSYCSLDTEGGVSCCITDFQLTTCRMKWRLQSHWLEYVRISYLMYRINKTRSPSTTYWRHKKSEHFQQTQILYWSFLQLCDSCNYMTMPICNSHFPPAYSLCWTCVRGNRQE